MNQKNRFILIGIIILAIVILHVLGIHKYINFAQLKHYASSLQLMVAQHYWLAVLLYLVVFVTATITGLPITIVLTIAAGFLFGILLGSVYILLGVTFGAILMFLSVRYLIGDWIQGRYSDQLQHFNHEIDQYGARYLLVLQILPFTPTFFINVFTGLTTISLWTFIWTTTIGVLPGMLIYTWIGRQLHVIQSPQDIIGTSLWLLLLLCGFAFFVTLIWRYLR